MCDSMPSEVFWLQLLWCCVQVDILSSDDEVHEVVKFVSDNAKRVLKVDAARVIPVSSRLALDAKLAVDDGSAGKALCHVLRNHPMHAHAVHLLKQMLTDAQVILQQSCGLSVSCKTVFSVWMPSVHSPTRLIVLQALPAGAASLPFKHAYSRNLASMDTSSRRQREEVRTSKKGFQY